MTHSQPTMLNTKQYYTVAYGISAEEQNDEQILRAYANTLCNYAATKLNRKIIRRGSCIKTLKDAMEEAEILNSQIQTGENIAD